MDKNKIEVGDSVDVSAKGRVFYNMEVLYIPRTVGDSWRFRRAKYGQLIYINHFNAMMLVRKGGGNG